MLTLGLALSFLGQLVAMAAYFGAVYRADAAMDKTGLGDIDALGYWNVRAGIAFTGLLVSWVTGLVLAGVAHWRGVPRTRGVTWPGLAFLGPVLLLAASYVAYSCCLLPPGPGARP